MIKLEMVVFFSQVGSICNSENKNLHGTEIENNKKHYVQFHFRLVRKGFPTPFQMGVVSVDRFFSHFRKLRNPSCNLFLFILVCLCVVGEMVILTSPIHSYSWVICTKEYSGIWVRVLQITHHINPHPIRGRFKGIVQVLADWEFEAVCLLSYTGRDFFLHPKYRMFSSNCFQQE